MPDVLVQLSESDLRYLLNSLAYSIRNISDSPHHSYETKLASLRPAEELQGKIREAIKQLKRKRTPAHDA